MPKENTEKAVILILIAMALLLASITSEPENEKVEIPQWGIYVYMAGDNSLSDAVDDDLAEMMKIGSGDEVEIIALVDQNDDDDSAVYRVLREELEEYNLEDINSTWYNEINMGNGETLRDFMKWSTTNFPAENTILIIWNHGVGWKSVADDNTENDYLTMNEIRESFEGSSVDLIAFDACSMSMFEVTYELRNNAEYILGSEEYEPLNGWTYDQIIPEIMNSSKPEYAAKNIVDAYVDAYRYEEEYTGFSITYAAVETEKLEELYETLEEFSEELENGLALEWNEINEARKETERYEENDFLDLYHFADLIGQRVENKTLEEAANNVKKAVTEAVLYNKNWYCEREECSSARSVENAHGMTIYFPDDGIQSEYDEIEAGQNKWSDFLDSFALGYISEEEETEKETNSMQIGIAILIIIITINKNEKRKGISKRV
tara:strand:- start:432 stop:1736 length:1305 start_codon:yes stop_codon:yes gene_type:complete